jgi:hypothetical protein
MSTETPVVETPAPEVPETPQPTPDLNPRIRAEKEIAARALAERNAEAAERIPGMEEAPPAETPAEETTGAVEAAPAEGAVPAAEEAPAPKIDPDAEVELIVDGKPLKVKTSQILEHGRKSLQKEVAADQRLELATRLLDEATKRAHGQPPSPEGAQPSASEVKGDVKEKGDAELAELIQYGTKEQAATAISEIRRRDAGTVTQDGLQEFISKQLPAVVSSQLAFHEAIRTAQSEYKDIFADPYLSSLFHIEEHKARQAGDVRPHSDLYKTIGDGIRAHFKLKAPTPSTGPTLEEKRELKAKAPSVPRLASVRLESAAAPKAKTREEILEGMKSQRGVGSIKKY